MSGVTPQSLRPAVRIEAVIIIEDERSPVVRRNLPQRLQKIPHRRYHAMLRPRFHTTAAMRRPRLKEGFQRGNVVVIGHQGFGGVSVGDSGAGGDAVGHGPGPGPYQQAVGVAVVAARELDNLAAAGIGPRQPNGAHAGLGAGTYQPYTVHRWQGLADGPGQFYFHLHGRAEAGSPLCGPVQRLHHGGVGVTQYQRAPGAQVVNVLVAVHVPDVGALPTGNKWRRSLHGPERPYRTVNAAGDVTLGLLK